MTARLLRIAARYGGHAAVVDDLIDDESRTTIASTFSWFYIRD
jgi:hypothetical protein